MASDRPHRYSQLDIRNQMIRRRDVPETYVVVAGHGSRSQPARETTSGQAVGSSVVGLTHGSRRLDIEPWIRITPGGGGCGPGFDCSRRWTGIEPAGRGSPVPTALKAAEPTRYPDTSAGHRTGKFSSTSDAARTAGRGIRRWSGRGGPPLAVSLLPRAQIARTRSSTEQITASPPPAVLAAAM